MLTHVRRVACAVTLLAGVMVRSAAVRRRKNSCSLVATPRSAGLGNLPKLPRSTWSWRALTRATSPARSMALQAAAAIPEPTYGMT